MIEHVTHILSGGEGERALLLLVFEHGRACWCAACAALRGLVGRR